MAELAKLPKDMVFFTQITMEAGEDGDYLDAMRKANIKGALVGVEAVTPEGLKAVFKDWNYSGEALAKQLQTFKQHGVHVLGSFIFGLPTDKPATFDATVEMALKAGSHLRPVCDDDAVSRHGRLWPLGEGAGDAPHAGGRRADHSLLADPHQQCGPKMFTPHPSMSSDEIRERTQRVWDRFYNWTAIWERSACTPTLRARLAFMFLSKLYRQMYAGTGISTDSARRKKSKNGAMDGEAVQEAVPGKADAGAAIARMGAGLDTGHVTFSVCQHRCGNQPRAIHGDSLKHNHRRCVRIRLRPSSSSSCLAQRAASPARFGTRRRLQIHAGAPTSGTIPPPAGR